MPASASPSHSSPQTGPRAWYRQWRRTWHQLLHNTGSQAPRLRRSCLGLLAAAVMQGLSLACLLPVLQASHPRVDRTALAGWLSAMAVLMLASAVLRWRAQGFDYLGHMATTSHELRTRLGRQLRIMPMEALQDRHSGEINATLLGNVDEHLNFVLTIVNLIMIALVVPWVTALATLVVDVRLGLLLLVIFPILLPLHAWRRPAYGAGMQALAQAHQRTNADIVEYTQGLAVLRAARCAGARAARLQQGFASLQQVQADSRRAGSKPDVLIASVVELGLLLVVAAGATWVIRGSLDLAVLAAVMVLIVRVSEPLATLIGYTAVFDLIDAALQRIDALLAIQALPQHGPAAMPAGTDIRVDAVNFRYAKADTDALHALSVNIPARSMTALVGPSGSGKSTLVRLLMRHADVQHGAISIGGVDIRSLSPMQLSAMISVVFQDVYLFDDTVMANIRMARPTASDDDVAAAARAAHCMGFIEGLPQGWDTRVGDIGGRLSGGERQRISIARALLKAAPIVILDEPTAALDSESELAVQAAIDTLVADRTVIVIAHRLSTIVGARQILVMDQGRLVEQGDHASLLAGGGRYQMMWQAQQAAKQWRPASGVLRATDGQVQRGDNWS